MNYQRLRRMALGSVLLTSTTVLLSAFFLMKSPSTAKNVLGTPLQTCCTDPVTGFYRNGRCDTGPEDFGTHVICAEMTAEFLSFTRSRGNDLSTPRPEYQFPGLKPRDKWCLCALRWREAWEAGVAPPVVLERTHEKALEYISLEALQNHVLAE